ncbi:MAG: bifunctional DNA-formamidopyrimidine glycosylase/DNA-(apurinic or apyrimidinic site) lyase [Deltaproteobacteria bacterium]|nr:bifunctional DNA-formamidopyrimidine glycosylase/DNA-(apurinic or apyrimidinic site) lyase [Deltaproteobacteria bacterium]
MPELPEVEHASMLLRRWLAGRTIARAEAESTRVFRGSDRQMFEMGLPGRRFERVDRRGKYLVLTFDGDVALLSHLGMTGKWIRQPPGDPAPDHSRARLRLDDGVVIHYSDVRLFGRLAIHSASGIATLPELEELGPDALSDGVDVDRLAAKLSGTPRAVKLVLMDQSVLAGIGNIQATEALFRARVHPARPGRSLDRSEVRAIARGIEASIAHTIQQIRREEEMRLPEEREKSPFLVYDRAGEPCPRCRTRTGRILLGGRTTAFCPRCQPRAHREAHARAA